MKSGKQRRQEIRQRRFEKAKQIADAFSRKGPWYAVKLDRPTNAVPFVAADHTQLAHNNTYGPLPLYYRDRVFMCRDCGVDDLWTAKQQKWWYEIAKGGIKSSAVFCRPCRKVRQERAAVARTIHIEGLIAKHGIEIAADMLQRTVEDVNELVSGRRRE